MPKMVVEVADRYTARRDGRPNNSGEADGEVRGDVPAKPRAGRGGGRCGVAEGGDGDVGRRSGAATGAAGGDVDEEEGEAGAGDGVPAKFGRGGGDAGEEGDAAVSKEETAASIGAPAMNSSRLEGVQWHQCHWLPAGAPFRRVSGEETLYIALSCVTSPKGLRVLIENNPPGY
uniref:Uncharacterized protein P0406D01.121 n=1 Tax=Oryza sativa subsp. japonica TaxID=39947 RepID=Q6Z084_ORYSJ|nr:hypothetical protein [Oryza sativa Japonica Group]